MNETRFEDLVNTIRNKIERTTWPTAKFKSSWCEEGQRKLLYTYEQYKEQKDALTKLTNQYKQLSQRFNEYKKDNPTSNKKRSRDTNPPLTQALRLVNNHLTKTPKLLFANYA